MTVAQARAPLLGAALDVALVGVEQLALDLAAVAVVLLLMRAAVLVVLRPQHGIEVRRHRVGVGFALVALGRVEGAALEAVAPALGIEACGAFAGQFVEGAFGLGVARVTGSDVVGVSRCAVVALRLAPAGP